MHYSKVKIESTGYELAPVVVTSKELEERIEPLYKTLHFGMGQLETLTGIIERRWWNPNFELSQGAIAAGQKALQSCDVRSEDIEALIYCGVNRESFEPATACRVAHELNVSSTAAIFDISNACLGVLNGMLEIANRIELGQIRAGMVVSCETSREINEIMIDKMVKAAAQGATPETMKLFTSGLATLTGGSGAVAIILSDGSYPSSTNRPELLGAVIGNAPEHYSICRWGVTSVDPQDPARCEEYMYTDSIAVLNNGVELGKRTWDSFEKNFGWTTNDVDRIICHQVGSKHQEEFLRSICIAIEKDFTTYPFLGNIGTVSLPITAMIAEERQEIIHGNKVCLAGIGSGLSCMMLAVQW